jgi:polyhydroxyalkanoate synthase
MDWAAHTANAPFQTAALGRSALTQWIRLGHAALHGEAAITGQTGDRRFSDPAWKKAPYALLAQSVLLGEEWWDSLTAQPAGVDPQNRRLVAFSVRQWLELLSPSNLPWLNPQVMQAAKASGGETIVSGLTNLLHDEAAAQGHGQSAFKVGVDVAATPGKVVLRNALMELIQYAPTTPTVGVEPVLIVPAWIMKYYILDLSPGNSLIRWLVGQGHTVFVISWRNPGADMRETSLDDYRTQGVMAAIDAVRAICGPEKIHATGYCLGGTLVTLAAAAMAREGGARLASLSLFAAQTDFTEAGELKLFITEDQLAFLNDMMETRGFLDPTQMVAAFQMLQADKLVWARGVHDYLLGETDTPNDLMAWSADGTRLPARMHIEYLRQLFLHNDLAEGRFQVDGRPLELIDIHLPLFVVGTERDIIAPWRSVFKLHNQNDGALSFVLTSGGHNAGIVSEPGHPRRHFRLRTREAGGRTLGPEEWEADTPLQVGSWWPAWATWLKARSSGVGPPPPFGLPDSAPLGDAPGAYVQEV